MLDTAKIIRECLEDLSKEFPELCGVIHSNYPNLEEMNLEAEVAYLKEHMQPHCMDLLKKNDDLFKVPRFSCAASIFRQ